MIKKALTHIPRGSILLASTTLGSYILGLLRDRTLAQTFGASSALDAYNAAFLLPDLFFNLLVASGIAAALVPLYIDLRKKDTARAYDYLSTIITSATGVMAIMSVVFFLLADYASVLVAPGLSPEAHAHTASLMRILALSPIFFAASNALGALLVAEKRFFYYGLSPLLYNAGIIIGALLLAPHYGIKGVAMGAVFGAVLHLTIRLYDARDALPALRPLLQIHSPEFRTTLRLMLPKMVGHPVEMATFWGFTALASSLAPGSITILNLARNFQSVPVSVVGLVIATTVFASLAHAASEKSRTHFTVTLKKGTLLILGGSIAAAIVTYLIGEPLIATLLGGKAFTYEHIRATAHALGIFTLSIPTEGLSHLIARAYYATQNTLIPTLASVASLIFCISSGYLLLPSYQLAALPLAFFIGSSAKLLIMYALLPRQIHAITSK